MADRSTTGLLDLPNELLHDIADLLDALKDLNSLARTNLSTFSTLNALLYRRDAKSGEGAALKWPQCMALRRQLNGR